MKPIPKQVRAQIKRAALIDAAQVCFVERGFDNTTAKIVADQAGVATGTFYQYFENKEDMLRVIARQRMDVLANQLPAIPESGNGQALSQDTQQLFLHVLELIYLFHEQAPELHQVLEQRRDVDEMLADILNEGEQKLGQRVLMFVKLFDVNDPETVAFNLFAMAEGIVHRHVFRDSDKSKQEVLETGAQMLAAYFDQL